MIESGEDRDDPAVEEATDAPSTTGGGRGRILAAVVVAAVLLGALVVLFATSDGSQGADTSAQVVSERAPELVGVTTTGDAFDLRGLEGKWVLVNFFATWCPPCVAEHPELVAFSEEHRDDAVVVSVAFDEPAPVIEEFFAEKGGDWPVIADDTGGIVLDYGVVKLPESYLIAPDGTVIEKFAGGVTAAALDKVITEHS